MLQIITIRKKYFEFVERRKQGNRVLLQIKDSTFELLREICCFFNF